MPATALAQTSPADLAQLSIEEPMGIEVTSASRKAQRGWDVPAAVHVITLDDTDLANQVCSRGRQVARLVGIAGEIVAPPRTW